jgi:hypothetical protein
MHTSRRLASNNDVVRITTKSSNIVPDPFDGETLIAQACILATLLS